MRLTRVLAASRRMPTNYHNMPQRYIDRQTAFVKLRRPSLPQYEEKVVRYKKNAYYDEWRPWERNFESLNQEGVKTPKIFVEPIRDWYFFRGDRVEVIKGPEKGKQGIIDYIVKERNWVFVQGLNVRRTYMGRERSSLGMIRCTEEPFLINQEVKLVDPSDLIATDIEWRYNDDGERVRVSTRTERVIPLPEQAYETIDYVDAASYRDADKDTPADLVKKVTYTPQVKTFEMDICEEKGIKDDRVPYPMYWY